MSRTHWLDEPRNLRRLWQAFLAMLAVTVLAEFAIDLHPHFQADAVFGFHATYGLIACGAMILAARALGALLKRPDSYYESRDE